MNRTMTTPTGGLPGDPDAGVVAAGLSAIGAFIGGVAVWVANRTLGKAAFQNAMNDGFTRITESLSAQLKVAEQDRDEARAANKEIRREFDRFRIKSEADRGRLHGEISNMRSTIEGLQRQLKAHGVNVPQPRHIEDDPDEPMIVLTSDGDLDEDMGQDGIFKNDHDRDLS